MPAGHRLGAIDLLGGRRVENRVDQRRLPGSGDPSHRDEPAQRERHVHVLQVVLRGADDGHGLAVAGASHRGHINDQPSRQVTARHGYLAGEQFLDRAGDHDLPAVLPRSRTDVDYPVGCPNGVLVVFDDDEGVAEVPKSHEGFDQPPVVALVQPDARLVQDVEHPDQPGADLCGQPDALRLTARQRPGRPRQRQVVQANVQQETQPLPDLLDHALRDSCLSFVERERIQVFKGLPDGQVRDLRDISAGDGDAQGLRPQARATAGMAVDLPHVTAPAFAR